MRKGFKFCIVALAFALTLGVTSCQSGRDEARSPIPTGDLLPATGEEAPDDIVFTPGGTAYRANVHQVGEENPWPPVEITMVVLVNGSSEISVWYRDYIETAAGEVRNNILEVWRSEQPLLDSSLNLYSIDVPAGIELTDVGGSAFPGVIATVLVIEVSPDVEPGQYAFEIGLEIDGDDYGTVPCTIEVLAYE
jgi:hypothetical protein